MNHLKNHLLRTLVLAASTVAVAVGAVDAGAAQATPAVLNEAQLAVTAVRAPTAPRSPAATPRNARVTLTWLAPSSNGGAAINKYAVRQATSTAGPWKTIAYPTTRSFTATELKNGTRYYFRIRAHNSSGWGPASTVVSAVPRTKPTAPRSPAVTPGNAEVKLGWLAPSKSGGAAVDKYAVQRATSAAGPWKTIAAPTTRSYTAGGLTNGTRYYFRIRAHNAAGWGPYSIVVNGVPRTAPSAPASLQAFPHGGAAYLSWLAPSSNGGAAIDMYEVTRSADQVNWTSLGTTTKNATLPNGLTNGVTYYFRVRAHNAAGWGPWSSSVSVVPRTVPSPPVGLWAYFDSIQNITWVYWSPPASDGGAAIDQYLIETSADQNTWNSYVVASTSYGFQFGGPGTYYFRVKAHNEAGYGPYSNIASITIP